MSELRDEVRRIADAATQAGIAAAGPEGGFAIVVVVQALTLDLGGGIPAYVGTNIKQRASDVEKVLQQGLKAVREALTRS